MVDYTTCAPAIRRFINADVYANANGDIRGFNMYAYNVVFRR